MTSRIVSAGIRGVRIRDRGPVFGDHQGSVPNSRIEDEEPPVRRVLRMKGETQQAAFAFKEHLRPDVEERVSCRGAGLNDPNRAGLLDDEEAVRAVAGMSDENRARQT